MFALELGHCSGIRPSFIAAYFTILNVIQEPNSANQASLYSLRDPSSTLKAFHYCASNVLPSHGRTRRKRQRNKCAFHTIQIGWGRGRFN